MVLRPQPIPPVPAATAAAVYAAFPKGNLLVDLRAEFGTLVDDSVFADLYPATGRPVHVGVLCLTPQRGKIVDFSATNR